MRAKRFCAVLAMASVCLLSSPALAGPSGTGIEKAGGEVTEYLINVLGPIVFLIGLIFAFYSWVLGDDRGIRRGISVVIGGALLFASPSIVEFIKSAVS